MMKYWTIDELMKKVAEANACEERRRSLQARSDKNTRTGLTHGLRVGEVNGVEHGLRHTHFCMSEGCRVGKARASEEGVGPHPRQRGLVGGCVACGVASRCTPKHVITGDCMGGHVDWQSYIFKLSNAMQRVDKIK